jgi:hypothetical protein
MSDHAPGPRLSPPARPKRDKASIKCGSLSLMLSALTIPAFAADAPPDKDDYTIFDPTPDALLRRFNTDRPAKANSPYTADTGHFQIETDVAVYSYGKAGGTQSQDWTVFDPKLKLGLNDTIDAELRVTPFEFSRTKSAGSTVSLDGWGDTYARLKVNVLGDDEGDVAVALLPYIELPTARSGLGNDQVEGGVILPVSASAPLGFTVIFMPEFDDLKNTGNDGYHGAVDFLINVSHQLDAKWTMYSEFFTTQSLANHDKPIYTLDEALNYAVTPNLQLDSAAISASTMPRRSSSFIRVCRNGFDAPPR